MKGKKFFTMDVHGRRGFTLVELIVVIAVLAILAGVAVPAYSGYVTKANKQADMSLINDIENALILAYYSDVENAGVGYVILTTDSIATDDSDFTKNALTASFGEYSNLALQYDGWTDGSYLKSLLSNANLQTVYNSTFFQYSAPAEMVSAVSSLTDSLSHMAQTASGDPISTMSNLNVLTEAEATSLRGQLNELNLSWVQNGNNSAYTTALANLLVKKASSDSVEYSKSEDENAQLSPLANLTLNYALLYAWGTSTEGGSQLLANLNATLTESDANLGSVLSAIDTAYSNARSDLSFQTYVGPNGAGPTDAVALFELLGVVNEWSNNKDMTTPGLYSSDSITDVVNNYTSSVSTAANLTSAQKTAILNWDGKGVLILIDATGTTFCSANANG